MTRASEPRQRKLRLIATICVLFAPLVIVKYAYFLTHDVLGLVPVISASAGDVSVLKFTLPLGISFVTFTLTAYVVDTYTRRYQGDSRFSTLLGYVLFFPHLIAGPILRPNELMSQLRAKRRAMDARFALGIALFTLGLVKKLVFADTIGEVVDPVFKPGAVASGWEYLLAFYGFSMQIYCDFSGYTDMAIGLAYLLRIRLPTNFLRPYISASPVEFWRRWHITLSHWLRDYLYIPLGGNRRGAVLRYVNLAITMLLGGLWHGAAWTFVVWGALHGAYLCVNHAWNNFGPNVPPRLAPLANVAGLILTFLAVVIAWVFFRADNMTTALYVLSKMADPGNVAFGRGEIVYALFVVAYAALAWFAPNTQQIMGYDHKNRTVGDRPGAWRLRPLMIYASAVVLAFGILGIQRYSEFIYFRF
jgi:D-alanyl-lipoteichoic acid acyltransferase DltB (MBOAT superfamily)